MRMNQRGIEIKGRRAISAHDFTSACVLLINLARVLGL